MKIVTQIDATALKKTIATNTEQERQDVLQILKEVRQNGDQAVKHYTAKFDGVQAVEDMALRVTPSEISKARQAVDAEMLATMQLAAQRVRAFHEQQMSNSWLSTAESGTILGQLIRPVQRTGVYTPGGTAAYPSSVLMTVIPAQVAGVKDIVLASPPDEDGQISPGVLAVADILGLTEIYKMGGAQAIAALAYGTETVPAVEQIVGPGNVYVTLAKKEVFGLVDIDMVAGPTDILVIADDQQNPAYVAADLLSQAEHDVHSAAICVTTSVQFADQVKAEVTRQLEALPRQHIAAQSLDHNGVIYVTKDIAEAVQLANLIAPEHLELLVEEPWQWLGCIQNAGAVFIGPYSTEPVGDYLAGPSHVLPTYGTARFSSGLNVDTFLKKSSLISYSRADLAAHAEHIARFARYEGLEGHARAVEIRFNQGNGGKE